MSIRNCVRAFATFAAACALHAADPAVITIQHKNMFPESITSTKDGTLIIGSFGTSTVWRLPAGQTAPTQWIDASKNEGPLLGVLADEKSKTLYVCQAGVKTFDLKTGAAKAQWTIPTPNPFCNDLAMRGNGDLYIADTRGAKVFFFRKGETTATEAASDPLLAGADGLAFLADQNVLYVNSVTTSKLLRLDLGKDGKATKVTEMKLSAPLPSPDGMRAVDGKRLIVAIGNCTTALATPNGDNVEVTLIKKDTNEAGCPAVTVTKGMAWTIEGKLRQRDAKNPEADKGPFRIFPVAIPK